MAEQEALKRRAEVGGYPSIEAYLDAQEIAAKREAIARGINPYPSPIVAGVGATGR
ncbi:hypothetical protein SEA_NETYAP_53 [Mycobacterium phage Netyap]|nr:hypothetical protein SEA_NETYAP_53 [Mycobacterium phage Netyap]